LYFSDLSSSEPLLLVLTRLVQTVYDGIGIEVQVKVHFPITREIIKTNYDWVLRPELIMDELHNVYPPYSLVKACVIISSHTFWFTFSKLFSVIMGTLKTCMQPYEGIQTFLEKSTCS
jgi:hypothetical protein